MILTTECIIVDDTSNTKEWDFILIFLDFGY
jgi:hypothetical protein